MLLAIAGWAAIRAVVSMTWRDPVVVGPLPVAGVLAVAIAVVGLLALTGATILSRRTAARAAAAADPAWPDPETRPQF
jgi:hypothetical protein